MGGRFDAVVVGGGVVGLSTAWRLAGRGLRVAVADPAPGSGASHAAAGMLAPVSEVSYTEEPLLRLGLDSLARWPAFAAELSDESGLGLDLRRDGTLDVAFGADDLALLGELGAFMEKLGLRVERLTGRECRRIEPMLAPSVRGGLLAPEDSWVDPRRVVRALLAALDGRGVPVLRERAAELTAAGDRAAGVRLADGRTLAAEHVVLATGAWAGPGGVTRGGLAGVPPGVLPPVRPVKGQIMRLRSPEPLLGHCVRGTVHGSPVYLVPRGDGELVLGATQEELAFDTRVTAGGLWELLRDARELVPGITELEVAETIAGLRPGTPDNLPLIGRTALPGLLLAAGHHRGGVLLAPLTAETVAGLVAGDGPALPSCSPTRFENVEETAP
ncbi:glycine oxidase ThiO [Thermocatellispora tengchongensis]|uniref:glycine oxidase ThiO n=1 Tax=Thermocatellispora tengchongensis TaxID=1073253 RepID=UPI00161C4586